MKKLLFRYLSVPPIQYYKFFKARYHRLKSKGLIREYLNKHKNPKLNIGCGANIQEGWLNTDIYPQSIDAGPVVYLNATIKFPFKDNTFENIYSEHIFEHLHFKDSCKMLDECYRVLKPGGTMRLVVPHLDFLLGLHDHPDKRIHKEYIDFSMQHYCKDVFEVLGHNEFSNIFVINNFYRDWGHQVIHNFGSLKLLVEHFQFKNVEQKEVGKSSIAALKDLDGHGRGYYPNEFYTFQSLAIEAQK